MLIASLLLLSAQAGQPVQGDLPPPAAQAKEISESKDIEAIRRLFGEWEGSWNRHDMAAFARLFREDAIWVGLSGRVWIGRPAIEAEHVESHRTFLRNSRQTVRVDEIRLIAPGVAIARLSTVVTGDETAKGGISRARKLFMLTRAADGIWEITAGQNTRLADNVSD